MDSLVLRKITQYYNFVVHDIADTRTQSYFLVQNPFHVALITFLYVYFVQKIGPQLMKNRVPFNLKPIMIVYNIIQVILNIVIFSQAFIYAYGPTGTYSFLCQPIDYSDSPTAYRALWNFHLYYMIKLLDLLDTIFMVLTKKFDHITFLHVYHHAGMFAFMWGNVKYYPGGHGAFLGMVNSFVHMIMYSYYLLSLIWISGKPKLFWWKKYLTILQIVQFVVAGIHVCLPIFIDCNIPKMGPIFVGPQFLFFTVMFTDFYIKSYTKTKPENSHSIIKKDS